MFNNARLTNFVANVLALAAVLALLVGGIVWVSQRPYFNISHIRIEPMQGNTLHYVSAATVQATIAGRVIGNFFSIDLDDTRRLLETVPWVRRAQVRRIWPNTLLVRLEEQQALALWNENQMINTWGEPFSANRGELPDNSHLPQLNGPDSSEQLVVQRYAELMRRFAPLDVRVREITLSPRYAWTVTLSNGLHLNLGRDPAADAVDPHGRSGAVSFAARIERFVDAWPKLKKRLGGRRITTADLRYVNGFAITLASSSSTSSSK